jgi:hypothetical protein
MVWRALTLNSKITISFWTKMALKLQFWSRKDVEYPATKNVLMLLHVK